MNACLILLLLSIIFIALSNLANLLIFNKIAQCLAIISIFSTFIALIKSDIVNAATDIKKFLIIISVALAIAISVSLSDDGESMHAEFQKNYLYGFFSICFYITAGIGIYLTINT